MTDQSGLDALTGCREIRGSVLIGMFDADFTPLRELQRIEGRLVLGAADFPARLGVADLVYLGVGPTSPSDQEPPRDPMTPVYRSLAGLESLELVEDLSIGSLGTANLESLSGLQAVTGYLSIDHCAALRDLSGLEQLREVGLLELSYNPELASLDGLPLLERTVSIFLKDLPKLSNIDALSQLESVEGSLELWGTALENLNGLSRLAQARDYLTLRDNPALIDISSLDNLTQVGVLEIRNNDALRRVPQFRLLQSINYFAVDFNDALEVFDAAMPSFIHINAMVGSNWYPSELQGISVGDNPKLTRIAISPRVSLISHIFINRNDSLGELDLGGAVDIGTLSITQNQRLDTIVRPELKTVRELGVKNNPQLSMSSFDGVKTAETDAADNAP